MNSSVGPLTTRPSTNGLTATTGAVAVMIASRIPGTARIGPMLITGLEGPMTIRSAAAIAAVTSPVGLAEEIPSSWTASIAGSARSRIRNSCTSLQPAGVCTRVRTGCSHIGSTVALTPTARTICSWAAVSRPPSARK